MSDDHNHEEEQPDDEPTQVHFMFEEADVDVGALTQEQKEAAMKESKTPLDMPEDTFEKFKEMFKEFLAEVHPDADTPDFDITNMSAAEFSEARRESLRKHGFGHDEFHILEALAKWVAQIADNAVTFTRIASLPISMLAYLRSEHCDLETLEELNKAFKNCLGTTPEATVVFTLIASMFTIEASRRHMLMAHDDLPPEVQGVAMHALDMASQQTGMLLAYAARQMFEADPCSCEDRFAELFDDEKIKPGAEILLASSDLDDELARLLAEGDDD